MRGVTNHRPESYGFVASNSVPVAVPLHSLLYLNIVALRVTYFFYTFFFWFVFKFRNVIKRNYCDPHRTFSIWADTKVSHFLDRHSNTHQFRIENFERILYLDFVNNRYRFGI